MSMKLALELKQTFPGFPIEKYTSLLLFESLGLCMPDNDIIFYGFPLIIEESVFLKTDLPFLKSQ